MWVIETINRRPDYQQLGTDLIQKLHHHLPRLQSRLVDTVNETKAVVHSSSTSVLDRLRIFGNHQRESEQTWI